MRHEACRTAGLSGSSGGPRARECQTDVVPRGRRPGVGGGVGGGGGGAAGRASAEWGGGGVPGEDARGGGGGGGEPGGGACGPRAAAARGGGGRPVFPLSLLPYWRGACHYQ